ncbi:conserved Plasmodium protein, unknown function [Plasmodium gallinaceum]|uniref:Fam-m protein n=1 Tax=Plasmodium gallinaceum TaxID=5849 RepID=A0A1J1GZQ3_PLAGA|nr:conserved Plasmodium protein, unknown function [Plasmodium gallinaceum]CRG97930.1 conserved Plasmodium protein, unknown function [Plasmodium gallinaceum]
MVLFSSIMNNKYENAKKIKEDLDIKTVEEEYIECKINNKKKKWSEKKLNSELRNLNHDIICMKKYKYYPFKKKCYNNFSFLKEGEEYYSSNEKLKKRNYKIIYENLKSSPPIQIAFCGILMTIIIGLLELKNKKF